MQVILQGSLRHFPAAELLAFLCRRTQSGTLDLETGGVRARILFDGDRFLWAESTKAGTPIDVLVEALDWTAGTFTLLDSIAVPDNATALAITFDELLAESRKRAEAASGYPESALFHVVDDPALQQQISLTSEEFKILFRVAAGRTFKELLADVTMPREELVEKLKRLEFLGLVVVQREEPKVVTAVPKKTTASRKRTLVGSLTPDGSPDNVYPLLDTEYTIGRAPENAITIQDGSVSSKHAQIVKTPQGFVIVDLQSRNGTFVNGERVTEKRQLADGDLIRVGKIIMTFNLARESKTGDVTQPEVRIEQEQR